VLAGALGLATRTAASLLDRQLAGRLTVQILAPVERERAREAAAALATLRALPQVRHAAAVDRAALASLLRPWLGSDGADPDLPIPAMIDADLRATPPRWRRSARRCWRQRHRRGSIGRKAGCRRWPTSWTWSPGWRSHWCC
jgi:cell division transport system permease protein